MAAYKFTINTDSIEFSYKFPSYKFPMTPIACVSIVGGAKQSMV